MSENQPDQELQEYRARIDAADREIVRQILERAAMVLKIGERKRASGTPVFRPDREKAVYENIKRIARELGGGVPGFDPAVLVNVYREIMSGSIALEGGPTVYYLGPEASFSHEATSIRFGAAVRAVPVDTISEVFRRVSTESVDAYGVVPIDNTTEGSVGITMDALLDSDLEIYGEHYLRIHLNLLHAEKIEPRAIKRLYALRIAREQCRNWLGRNLNLGMLEIVEAPSTAAAARLAAERRDGAAIASDLAARTYNLQVVGERIQDNLYNVTRFLVIGRHRCGPTGDDKTSLICAVRDEPGSLFGILKPFYDQKINLTRIESRVTRKSYGDYYFFIDFLGHRDDPVVSAILKELQKVTSFLKILGSYPRSNLP